MHFCPFLCYIALCTNSPRTRQFADFVLTIKGFAHYFTFDRSKRGFVLAIISSPSHSSLKAISLNQFHHHFYPPVTNKGTSRDTTFPSFHSPLSIRFQVSQTFPILIIKSRDSTSELRNLAKILKRYISTISPHLSKRHCTIAIVRSAPCNPIIPATPLSFSVYRGICFLHISLLKLYPSGDYISQIYLHHMQATFEIHKIRPK